METYDLIVIGGGIAGAPAAYHAAQRRQHAAGGSQRRGPGHQRGRGHPRTGTEQARPGRMVQPRRGRGGLLPSLVEALAAVDAGPTSYARCGMLLVALTDDEVDDFQAASEYIFARQQQRARPRPPTCMRSPRPRPRISSRR
ncbi:MAG: FAD-dependent oxidoreductase [Caldilineaceae bacterium]